MDNIEENVNNITSSSLDELGELLRTSDDNHKGFNNGLVGKGFDLNEFLHQSTHMGNPNRGMSDILYGINHALRGSPSGLRRNLDFKSLMFIVRPQFNLRDRYLVSDRKMTGLLNSNNKSIPRFVRMTLDPRLGALGDTNGKLVTSPRVDNEMAFIPLLTNSYDSSSGWPDTVAATSSTDAGIMKEEHVMIDGVSDMYHKFDLDINFHNVENDAIAQLFSTWVRYPTLTYKGIMAPYYDMIRANEIDYTTRIYILLLTPSGQFVKKIASTGYSFPVSVPDGAVFNRSNNTEPFENADSAITIRFQNVGAVYNDPVTILNFNATVSAFSEAMRMVNANEKGHGMVMIPQSLNKKFNFMGKPRIDLFTLELQFWIEEEKLRDKGILETNFDKLTDIFKD